MAKSSFSQGTSNCVGVFVDAQHTVYVIDTKLDDASHWIEFGSTDWARLLVEAKQGLFDWDVLQETDRTCGELVVRKTPYAIGPGFNLMIGNRIRGKSHSFTADEWAAFISGIKAGEFNFDRMEKIGG